MKRRGHITRVHEIFPLESREISDTGPRSPRTPDAVTFLVTQTIERFSASIGVIQPWRVANLWADLPDAAGNPIGRVNIRVVPNGKNASVELLFSGTSPIVHRVMQQNLVLQNSTGEQATGEWQQTHPGCRFVVSKKSPVTLRAAPIVQAAPAEVTEQNVRSLIQDQTEQIQGCLGPKNARVSPDA